MKRNLPDPDSALLGMTPARLAHEAARTLGTFAGELRRDAFGFDSSAGEIADAMTEHAATIEATARALRGADLVSLSDRERATILHALDVAAECQSANADDAERIYGADDAIVREARADGERFYAALRDLTSRLGCTCGKGSGPCRIHPPVSCGHSGCRQAWIDGDSAALRGECVASGCAHGVYDGGDCDACARACDRCGESLCGDGDGPQRCARCSTCTCGEPSIEPDPTAFPNCARCETLMVQAAISGCALAERIAGDAFRVSDTECGVYVVRMSGLAFESAIGPDGSPASADELPPGWFDAIREASAHR